MNTNTYTGTRYAYWSRIPETGEMLECEDFKTLYRATLCHLKTEVWDPGYSNVRFIPDECGAYLFYGVVNEERIGDHIYSEHRGQQICWLNVTRSTVATGRTGKWDLYFRGEA